MITREEYNLALDIVEKYHNQIFNINTLRDKQKTLIMDWDKLHLCSRRLYNILRVLSSDAYPNFKYIEDMEWGNFRRVRNAGAHSWREFSRLRGDE